MLRKGLLLIFIFLLLTSSLTSISYAAEPPSSVEVNIPNYAVTTRGSLDYIDIPEGDVLLAEEGRPRVPYYTKSIEYPKGCRVQDVIMKQRSGLKTEEGLKLPVVVLSPNLTDLPEMKKGWYPEEDYRWRVWENSDGSTTLIIMMYPFYYNPETAEVKFYRNYRFDIEYVISTVTITTLSTDRDAYEPGDEVTLDMCLNNSGETQNVVVNTVIKQYGSNEIVNGLPLKTLKKFTGDASYSVTWNTDNAELGYYYAEATLTDTSGNVLDKKTVGIPIQLHVTEEKPTPAKTGTPTQKPTKQPTGPLEKLIELPALYLLIGGAIVILVVLLVIVLIMKSKKR